MSSAISFRPQCVNTSGAKTRILWYNSLNSMAAHCVASHAITSFGWIGLCHSRGKNSTAYIFSILSSDEKCKSEINSGWQGLKIVVVVTDLPPHQDGGKVVDNGFNCITHWGRVTHICVSKLTTIGSDNGLSPGRRQAIIWTKAGMLLV